MHAPRCVSLVAQAVGYSADYADQAPQIMLLQFNPHWECFKGPNMEQTLGRQLSQGTGTGGTSSNKFELRLAA